MTQTSSGKTQGSLNIINVKNTLKACSIRVKQGVLFILEHQFFQGVLFMLEHQFFQGVLPFAPENFCCMNFALNSLKKCTEMLGITNILLPLPLIMKI